jgi:hypothetical protein
MSIYKILLAASICIVPMSPAASRSGTSVALVSARVEAVELMSVPQPRGYIGGTFRAKVKMSEALIGSFGQKELALVIEVSSQPVVPFDAKFLLETVGENDVRVLWWGFGDDRLCISREILKRYDIESALDEFMDRNRDLSCLTKDLR